MSKWAKCPYEQIWCQMSTWNFNLLQKYPWVYHAHGTSGCTMSELKEKALFKKICLLVSHLASSKTYPMHKQNRNSWIEDHHSTIVNFQMVSRSRDNSQFASIQPSKNTYRTISPKNRQKSILFFYYEPKNQFFFFLVNKANHSFIN